MEQIIDVEYKEIENLNEKSTEQLAIEANTLYQQFISVGNIAAVIMAQAGKRLQVIKGRLQHGEWEPWCEKNLDFSKSKAEKMMKLASKMEDEASIFSKTETFTDIGISKIWALLSSPEDVTKKVMENPEMPDMTVRELKDELNRIKDEKEAMKARIAEAEKAKSDAEEALEAEVRRLQEELQAKQEDAPAELEEKEAELQKAKEKLEKEREKSKRLKASIEDEKEKAAKEAARQAEAEAKVKFQKETELLRTSNQEAAAEIDRLQRAIKNSNDESVLAFKLKANQLQQDFNACLNSIADVAENNQERANQMKAALKTVMQKLMEDIGDEESKNGM